MMAQRPAGVLTRANGEPVQPIATYLPLSMALTLRLTCHKRNVSISEFVLEAVNAALEQEQSK